MALIVCPECNREISDKAQKCPHCGYPFPDIQQTPSIIEDNADKEVNELEERKEILAKQDKCSSEEVAPQIEHKDEPHEDKKNEASTKTNSIKKNKYIYLAVWIGVNLLIIYVIWPAYRQYQYDSENTYVELARTEQVAVQEMAPVMDSHPKVISPADFIREFYNRFVFGREDLDMVANQYLTVDLIRTLKAANEYEGDYIAIWKFRSGFQDGPSNESKIVSTMSEGNGNYVVNLLDMGNTAKIRLHLQPKGESFLISFVELLSSTSGFGSEEIWKKIKKGDLSNDVLSQLLKLDGEWQSVKEKKLTEDKERLYVVIYSFSGRPAAMNEEFLYRIDIKNQQVKLLTDKGYYSFEFLPQYIKGIRKELVGSYNFEADENEYEEKESIIQY